MIKLVDWSFQPKETVGWPEETFKQKTDQRGPAKCSILTLLIPPLGLNQLIILHEISHASLLLLIENPPLYAFASELLVPELTHWPFRQSLLVIFPVMHQGLNFQQQYSPTCFSDEKSKPSHYIGKKTIGLQPTLMNHNDSTLAEFSLWSVDNRFSQQKCCSNFFTLIGQ